MSLSPKSYADFYTRKLIHPSELAVKIEELKKQGKTVATLNGSFDLLHAGHLEMIYQASLQADVLLVALNSDASIRQYKSPDRPIIPLEFRLRMMAALEMSSMSPGLKRPTALAARESAPACACQWS